MAGKSNRSTGAVDPYDVTGLMLYQSNTESLYRTELAIQKALARKLVAGKYDQTKAPAAWRRLVEETAKRHRREFGEGFSAAARKAAAEIYAREFESMVFDGGLANLYEIAGLKPPR